MLEKLRFSDSILRSLRLMLAGTPPTGAIVPVPPVEVPGQVDQRRQVADTDRNESDGEQ